ncbi:Alpha/Beta hydrolase protein [Mycena polygramma]|nr:Alpha/Beta hydrolase protein [Mycena polygramma]
MTSDAYTEAWLVGPQATKFYTRTYLAPPSVSRAVLVFIHGFSEHVGRYTWAHPQFAQRGINVFTFDQRGFGKTALDAENKSESSSYGRTSGEDQMDDIKWALEHAVEAFPGLPLFLSGHSMGGGEVLNFPVRRDASMLAGVIVSSPIIEQTKPTSKMTLAVARIIGVFLPYMTVPAPADFNELSHDSKYNQVCSTDPLAKLQGTLRCTLDMLDWGELMLRVNYKNWPKTLPAHCLHFPHHTYQVDLQVTSHNAVKAFYDKIICDHKVIRIFPDGFHELIHEPEHKENLIIDEITFIEEHLHYKGHNQAGSS